MPTAVQHDEDLARRVYAFFIFRLRQPEDAERLTRLSFERLWREANLSPQGEQDFELPIFAAARATIAESPRPRGASRVLPAGDASEKDDDSPRALGNQLAMAMGRLHGREREALALRFGAELSVGEIAELIDRPPAEVKQRLARGVRALIQLGVLPKDSSAPSSAAERPRAGGPEQGEAEQRESDE
jgi:DNA-directed RNA polymerase specialized sigma24 family protein